MDRCHASHERTDAALALLDRHEAALRRTARRVSICADDAEDSFQRALVILLTRAPRGAGPGRLAAWMQVVTRREALAVRRERERMLAGGPAAAPGRGGGDPAGRLACERPGPEERAELRDRVELARGLLSELKPNERLAILLHACGYTYAEIAAECGWTYTKVNRCLVEGRARLRSLVAAGERR